MTCNEGYFRTMFILVLCSMLLCFSNCAVINKVQQLSPWDDGIDWWNIFPTTREPYIWEKYTLSPDDYTYRSRYDSTPLMLLVFVPMVLGVILVLICKFIICKDKNTSSSTSHSPIRIPIPPPEQNGTQHPPQNRTQPTTQSSRQSTSNPNRNSAGTVNHPSSRNNTTDKPPGYADVILDDFRAAQSKFPGVRPTTPETPPPKYNEENIMRY